MSSMFDTFRCAHCGDVIGVYEPLVECQDSHSRTTSRAAEPGLKATDGSYYHRRCFHERASNPLRSD
jgi:hypothetical protein